MQPRVTPLSMMPTGSTGRVIAFRGGYGSMRRMMEMGITPGTIIRVINNSVGPILIEVRGAVYALGRGMASKVLVELL
ncbi:MAG: ferrous iron transport protein A [Thermoprotei archaeon]|nr:MAG: ferrous iron transport protein A [Thermoprotei archaeon]